jgi:hypothetical protein
MRNLTILFVFISFQISVAQDYVPFPDSNAIWTSYRIDVTCGDPLYICYFDQFTLTGDTIIGTYSYNKIVRGGSISNNYFGGIRNDIPEKKVYFLKAYTDIDTLLYDFNINIGDTVPVSYTNSNVYPAPWTVISIDSIFANGQYRKRFNISNTGWETSLIEGIGSVGGLFEEYFYPEGSSTLLCFFQNDSNVYPEGNINMEMCHLVQEPPNCSDTTYLPTITASGPLTVCYGDTIILEAESGYDAYLWSTGDTTQSISVSDSGDYSVSALVDTCWFGSDTVEISISNPMPIVTVNVDDLISSGGFVSYQWYFNGEPITVNGNFQVYHACQYGNYYVEVTDQYGCTGQSSIIEHACCPGKIDPCDMGIEDNNNLPVTIYPNPATTTFTIEFPASANFKTAELSIQTISGQLVFQSAIQNPKSAIDISAFSKGLYLFKVQAGDEVVVKKVVVE